jgi:hypothetical protein
MAWPFGHPSPALYAPPQTVTDPAECKWYHSMDLPGLGTVEGVWDLRATVDEYLGGLTFTGQRVLDVGAASGYLTFEVERRGAAAVVSADAASVADLDLVPFATPGYDLAAQAGSAARPRRGGYRAPAGPPIPLGMGAAAGRGGELPRQHGHGAQVLHQVMPFTEQIARVGADHAAPPLPARSMLLASFPASGRACYQSVTADSLR